MDNRPIGVMDSGVGGMSTVKVLRSIMPEEDIVYFGDTANVPYGPRSAGDITRLSRAGAKFLMSQNVKCILVACGTISCTALTALRRDCDVPVIGVIEPTAEKAAELTENGKVGIIATQATVSSGAFPAEISRIRPNTEFTAVPAPRLVTLVEAGKIQVDDIDSVAAAREYLASVILAGCDTLILGCTHFPLLTDIFASILGEGVKLVSSGGELARAGRDYLIANGLAAENGAGRLDCCISGSGTELFAKTAELFLGGALPQPVRQVDITG